MTASVEIEFPDTLTMRATNLAAMASRSRFLLALKYFELGEITSGQAATMSGMGRIAFLAEAARLGVPAVELVGEDLVREFADA